MVAVASALFSRCRSVKGSAVWSLDLAPARWQRRHHL